MSVIWRHVCCLCLNMDAMCLNTDAKNVCTLALSKSTWDVGERLEPGLEMTESGATESGIYFEKYTDKYQIISYSDGSI